jgi:hypothetical protein
VISAKTRSLSRYLQIGSPSTVTNASEWTARTCTCQTIATLRRERITNRLVQRSRCKGRRFIGAASRAGPGRSSPVIPEHPGRILLRFHGRSSVNVKNIWGFWDRYRRVSSAVPYRRRTPERLESAGPGPPLTATSPPRIASSSAPCRRGSYRRRRHCLPAAAHPGLYSDSPRQRALRR